LFDKRLMKMCPESRKYIIGNIILQFTELVLNVLMIGTIAAAVQKLFNNEMEPAKLWIPVLIIAGTVAVRFFTTKYAMRMSYLASRTVKRVMRERIYGKLLRLGAGYREYTDTAALVQESVEGVDQLESYFGLYMPQFFYAFLAPLALFFTFGFAGSWKVAAVLLVCVPLIPGAIMVVQKIAKKILAKYWGQYTQLGSTFLENLQGMTALKTYQADEYKNEQMNAESEHFRKVTMAVLTMQLNSVTIMDFVAYGGAALGILLATAEFVRHNITLGVCLFMILLSADFFLPMRRLGSYFHVAMNGMAASDKIFQFLNCPEPEGRTEVPAEGSKPDISFKNVNFSYDGQRQVLKNICIEVPARGFTGIVGESGSGKSTVASLITGRHSVKDGLLTLGGTEVNKISEEFLMRTVTYVGFHSVFFKGTVRDNLLLAQPGASEEAMWEALEKSALADYFRGQNGLDTALGEDAAELSGGQKQRLALARALLHDSPVYIFDEATSNIDVESEETILRQIHELAGSRTVIMITHRLANVTGADRIFCLDDGELAGSGTHAELLSGCEAYTQLWRTQAALENFGKEAV